ncbi:sphingolipid delta(4)-desaturase DES1-like [Topomyia yanbarensis]|uniref:sphingolipid delta(4)-desaturase DES1-like n=1 Tax=Topomyia yanbarensis TaxID=2498891 RepID=UPI00273C6B01|nr:sphingolipid delta(4)-desaturase DES1-like [Topomyia yanbarensis]
MGQHVSRTDFEWVYDEQPHIGRRDAMLKKYPQIKNLYGPDPAFKYIVSAMVLTQVLMLYVMQNQSWTMITLVAYCFGGVINHSLMLANHEISHNMAFGYGRPLANRYFGMWCNLPIGIPMSVSFKKYHTLHHRYLANEKLDPDVPSILEAKLFCNTFGKFIWVILQPLFYALRPLFVNPLPVEKLEIINTVVQVIFDGLVVLIFGWRMLAYLLIGSFLAMGIHPVAGHFIAEHYMFAKGFETYSYYGSLNSITFNVGYHNEHHDFPAIPGSRLPEVKRIAPEFYDTIPQHTSWVRVMYDFVMDPAVGPYARIKRRALQKAG